ncbi:MAG: RluA family pseudouridine synthase [Oscillospiraceae bacterium]
MKEIIYKNKKSARLDTFLQDTYPLFTIGTINKFLRQNKIKVNGVKPAANTKLSINDKITLYTDDCYLETPTKDTAFKFSGKNLEVIYEDDNILVVNKPSGIPVVDSDWNTFDTLVNRVLNHYYLLDKQLSFTPALCHRIDTGTQGLVILAKSQQALDFMVELFKDKGLEKSYICVVAGAMKAQNSIEKAYLIKSPREGYVTISQSKKNENSKPIETHIHSVSRYGNYSLLDVGLVTGRTHQIRAHLAYLNMPILGDSRYGDNALNRKLKLKYQLLCSYKIKFGSIDDENFKYLSGKVITCKDPWFIESFYNREFYNF